MPAADPPRARLAEVFEGHDGLLSDKWEQYLGIYDAFLARRVADGQPLKLLEIGVQNGGSLEIWSKYLPAGSTVTGIDIDSRCAALPYARDVRVLIGDAADPEVLETLLPGETFDVIIDDGSHVSPEVIATFEACVKRLRPGGLYFVEDLHASYRASHAGGFRDPGSAIEWFKSLADAVNSDHFEEADGNSAVAPLKRLGREIQSVSFFDSVVVVTKFAETKVGPFDRMLTGTTATMFGPAILARELPLHEVRSLRLAPATTERFTAELLGALASSREEVGRLQSVLSAERDRIKSLNGELQSARTDTNSIRRLSQLLYRALRRNVTAFRRRLLGI